MPVPVPVLGLVLVLVLVLVLALGLGLGLGLVPPVPGWVPGSVSELVQVPEKTELGSQLWALLSTWCLVVRWT